MEPRIAKLESDVAHIQTDVSEIRADVREVRTGGAKDADLREVKGDLRNILYAGIAAVAALLIVFWNGYARLSDYTIAATSETRALSTKVTTVVNQHREVLRKLNRLAQTQPGVSHIPRVKP
jgi:hypothetical protein